MELTTTLLIPLLSGFAGFFGGVIATYLKWDVEKRKIRAENRKDRIREWRQLIDQTNDFDNLWGSSVYHELEPFISDSEKKELHSMIMNKGYGGNETDIKKGILFSAISKIEKNWDLL